MAVVVANMIGTGVFTSLGFQLLDIQSGFVLMMLFDPLYGLGAIIVTLAVLLGVMLGWLPMPSDRRRGRVIRR